MRSRWPPASSRMIEGDRQRFFPPCGGRLRGRKPGLDAAQLSASAARAAIVDGHVAALSRGAGAAVIDVAINYDASSNPGADRGAEDASIPRPAPQSLCQSRCVAVIVDTTGR